MMFSVTKSKCIRNRETGKEEDEEMLEKQYKVLLPHLKYFQNFDMARV